MVLLPPGINLNTVSSSGSLDEAGFMFSPSLLTPSIVGEVADGLSIRPLHIEDYDRGFLDCLSQLTTVGTVSKGQWLERFRSMRNSTPQSYYVVVVEEESSNRVVGAATLVVEWKFIHSAGCRGRVEDVVIDREMRGKKLGALLNRVLVGLAKQAGVYKLSLECKDHLISFYELYGYKKDQGNNFLVQRFDRDLVIPTHEMEQSKI